VPSVALLITDTGAFPYLICVSELQSQFVICDLRRPRYGNAFFALAHTFILRSEDRITIALALFLPIVLFVAVAITLVALPIFLAIAIALAAFALALFLAIALFVGVACWRSLISVLVLILTLVSTGRGRQIRLASKIPFYLL
jgi:hypothetical protein